MDKNHHWCFLKIKTLRSSGLERNWGISFLKAFFFFFELGNKSYLQKCISKQVSKKQVFKYSRVGNKHWKHPDISHNHDLLLWQWLFYIFWSFVKIISCYICFLDAASFTEHLMRDFSMWSHVTVVYSFHCCKVFHYMITPQWSSLLLLDN